MKLPRIPNPHLIFLGLLTCLPVAVADKHIEYSVNRYSMPVTKSRTAFYDINLDQANTTGFLFGDDDNVIEGKLYTQANNEDNFPVLRREPNMVSQKMVSSTASTSFSLLFTRTISTLAGLGSSFRKLRESVWLQSTLVESCIPLTPALALSAHTLHLHLGACIFSARLAHPPWTSPHLTSTSTYLSLAFCLPYLSASYPIKSVICNPPHSLPSPLYLAFLVLLLQSSPSCPTSAWIAQQHRVHFFVC